MESATIAWRLRAIDSISNDEWFSTLDERKLKELEFHDRDRNRDLINSLDQDTYERFYGNKKYYQRRRARRPMWMTGFVRMRRESCSLTTPVATA